MACGWLHSPSLPSSLSSCETQSLSPSEGPWGWRGAAFCANAAGRGWGCAGPGERTNNGFETVRPASRFPPTGRVSSCGALRRFLPASPEGRDGARNRWAPSSGDGRVKKTAITKRPPAEEANIRSRSRAAKPGGPPSLSSPRVYHKRQHILCIFIRSSGRVRRRTRFRDITHRAKSTVERRSGVVRELGRAGAVVPESSFLTAPLSIAPFYCCSSGIKLPAVS